MRKLKIIGSFAVTGTKVIDQETGAEIPNVKKVTWTHEAGKTPVCIIELVGTSLAATGDDITPLDSPSGFRQYKEKV